MDTIIDSPNSIAVAREESIDFDKEMKIALSR
jgi:hypothetical protein